MTAPTLTPTGRLAPHTGQSGAPHSMPAGRRGHDQWATLRQAGREQGRERVLSYARWWGVLVSSSFFFHVAPHISEPEFNNDVLSYFCGERASESDVSISPRSLRPGARGLRSAGHFSHIPQPIFRIEVSSHGDAMKGGQ